MSEIEFKKEIKKNNTRLTQNGIKQMDEGNSKTLPDNIRKFEVSMDLNNIGVLRHKGKTPEKDCHRAALFQRIFSDVAHLTGKQFDDAFYERTKVEVKEKLAHTVGNHYKEEAKKDLHMRLTMNELKQAIKKMKTNNKGVDPYGLHPKLFKKFNFNTINIYLHLINIAFFIKIWPFDKTIVKLLKNLAKLFIQIHLHGDLFHLHPIREKYLNE